MSRSKAFGNGSETNQSPRNGPLRAAADICDSLPKKRKLPNPARGYAVRGMRLRLIRNATLHVRVAGRCLLIDPMPDPAGARPPGEDTANPVRNPTVELPEPPEIVAGGLHGVIVTHLHRDHLDDTAVELLDKGLPVFGQPEDAERLRERGFADVRPVEDELE